MAIAGSWRAGQAIRRAVVRQPRVCLSFPALAIMPLNWSVLVLQQPWEVWPHLDKGMMLVLTYLAAHAFGKRHNLPSLLLPLSCLLRWTGILLNRPAVESKPKSRIVSFTCGMLGSFRVCAFMALCRAKVLHKKPLLSVLMVRFLCFSLWRKSWKILLI